MSDRIFMETTRIAPERTVSEIQQILAQHGAHAILLNFEEIKVSAVSFKVDIQNKEIAFMLPCRWKEMETILRQSGRRPASDDSFENWSRRVAWRQILRWVQAQFALVETGMVKIQEVFLPYIQGKDGKTIYEKLEESKFKLLENKP